MPPKKLLVLIIVSLLIIVCILWFLNCNPLSEKGAKLTQVEIKKDIAVLTKGKLKINRIEIVNNGFYENATLKKNGVVDSRSQVIYILGETKSPYPVGMEYKVAVQV